VVEPGLLITFEGPEGSGKTTQASLLADRLRAGGRGVIEVREPGGTEIGEEIRTTLLKPRGDGMLALTELFLFLAARAQIVDEVILPALAAGKIVVCDRFADSTTVYQSLARGIDREMVDRLNAMTTQDRKPDLTLLLDLDPEIGLARLSQKNRLDGEDREFHERVREGYLVLAQEEPGRFRTLDAREPPDVVADAVWRAVRDWGRGIADEADSRGHQR
jgi:dTMP kinase